MSMGRDLAEQTLAVLFDDPNPTDIFGSAGIEAFRVLRRDDRAAFDSYLSMLNRDQRAVLLRRLDEPGPTDACAVDLIRADQVKVESVRWLWDGYLAAGKLHVLAGAAGTGKTTVGLAVAATLTVGGRWPDGARATRGSVLIWSGEDDRGDVLVPRLAAMSADLSLVSFVGDVTAVADGKPQKVAFDPARDMDMLARRIGADPPALLIVDPIVSAVSGDSHKNAEVRRGLQPLVDLAQAHGIAVLGVTHFSKGTQGRDPTERVTGSLAFGALARVVFVASRRRDDDGTEQRIFMRAKSNISSDEGGFHYCIEQRAVPGYAGVFASCVTWGDRVEGHARDVLDAAESADDDRTGTDEAIDFLRHALRHGSVAAAEIKREAKLAGISEKCLRSARLRIGARAVKAGFGSGWIWCLPAEDAQTAQDAPNLCSQNEGIFGVGGHLREAAPVGAGAIDDAETL